MVKKSRGVRPQAQHRIRSPKTAPRFPIALFAAQQTAPVQHGARRSAGLPVAVAASSGEQAPPHHTAPHRTTPHHTAPHAAQPPQPRHSHRHGHGHGHGHGRSTLHSAGCTPDSQAPTPQEGMPFGPRRGSTRSGQARRQRQVASTWPEGDQETGTPEVGPPPTHTHTHTNVGASWQPASGPTPATMGNPTRPPLNNLAAPCRGTEPSSDTCQHPQRGKVGWGWGGSKVGRRRRIVLASSRSQATASVGLSPLGSMRCGCRAVLRWGLGHLRRPRRGRRTASSSASQTSCAWSGHLGPHPPGCVHPRLEMWDGKRANDDRTEGRGSNINGMARKSMHSTHAASVPPRGFRAMTY